MPQINNLLLNVQAFHLKVEGIALSMNADQYNSCNKLTVDVFKQKDLSMLELRKSDERGYADHGWLKSYHSFSFANYYDPKFMGWGNLRVINEDRIEPGRGFGQHGHRDMEIISYVLSGELAHQDSLGNVKGIPPGDIQRMSAGTGVVHSEFNHAANQQTHFLQIWIEPSIKGIAPGYEQKTIPQQKKQGALCLVASSTGELGSVTIHADAKLYVGIFDSGHSAKLSISKGRKAYVHLIAGSLQVNGLTINGGDALLISDEEELEISDGERAEVLVFDLAPN